MIFSSIEFIFLFLPITIFFYWFLIRKPIISFWFLSIASLYYYAFWKLEYIFLIITSIIINFFLGELIASSKKKTYLTLGITLNLIALGFFKYTDFLIKNINNIFNLHISEQNIVLPLAISFFTFQQIAFLVDCYKGIAKEYSFEKYLLFISFFPQLIAGPIVHHAELIPQFYSNKIKFLNWDNIYQGIFRFSLGLFKKVVIADSLSKSVSLVFDTGESFSTIETWIGVLFYTFQIYFDFSGYSDMAIGIGKFFNINIPENFNSPYKSLNIIDFWRRWHITLSTFLRDYLYIPLGGNRNGKISRYRNLLLTMLLGGIWHGAGWNFLIWGGLHGSYLVINHFLRYSLKNIVFGKFARLLSWAITFVGVVIAWVFFRAKTFSSAQLIILNMFGSSNLSGINHFSESDLSLILALLLVSVCGLNGQELNKKLGDKIKSYPVVLFIFVILFIPLYKIVFEANRVNEFLYFDF